MLEALGLSEQATPVLRAPDKLAKIGADEVAAEMTSAGLSDAQAAHILQTVQTEGSNRAVLDQLSQQLSASERAMEGVADLRQLADVFEATHISEDRLRVDVSIARGLDYYTGTVYETLLDDLPGIGSICSGGRYDNTAALYTKQHLPGVGASARARSPASGYGRARTDRANKHASAAIHRAIYTRRLRVVHRSVTTPQSSRLCHRSFR